MGLTVAEAFMLIAFVLLMLLLFWRYQVQDDLEFMQNLSQEQRQALNDGHKLVPPGRLAILVKRERLVANPAQRRLAEEAAKLPPEQLRKLTDMARNPQALATDTTLVAKDRLTALEEQERLVANPAQRRLAEEAAKLPPEQLRKLTDIARDPLALTDKATRVSHERMAELEAAEKLLADHTSTEIKEALNLREALDPYGEDSNEALLEKIGELQARRNAVDAKLAEEAQAQKDFVEELRGKLATEVEAAGGRIEPTGRIVFPDSVLFETGRAEIAPSFRSFLDTICPVWLAKLREGSEGLDVADIRIEGHSSPEWRGAPTVHDAWVKNLNLSQRRAQSVLVYCLEHVQQTPLGDWARRKLTAVGYSSSRPVMTGEIKDWRKSRRVVLGHDFSHDKLIAKLGGTSNARNEAIKPISGRARVIDADTIKIESIGIRLDGIDAPELDQVCTRNEKKWRCGREARKALVTRIGDRVVICDNLRPGLQRLRGRCRVDGEDGELNRWVVNAGWAFAFVKYSDEYAADEAAARDEKRGIWAGDPPMPPQEWRRHNR